MYGCESVGLTLHEALLDDHQYMTEPKKNRTSAQKEKSASAVDSSTSQKAGLEGRDQHAKPRADIEIGGSEGLEPTRFGDWEKNGRCTDF